MQRWPAAARYGGALAGVALVTAVIGQVPGGARIANVSMLYLAAVLFSALYLGRGPAVLAAFTSFLSFNWFFVEPVHRVTVADPADLVSLLLFLLTAVVTGQLAADQRARAQQAREREREALVLYDIVRLMAEQPLAEALHAVADRLRRELGLEGAAIEVDELAGAPLRTAAGGDRAQRLLEQPARAARFVIGGGHTPTDGRSATPGRWVRVMPPSQTGRRDVEGRLYVAALTRGERRRGQLLLLRPSSATAFSSSEDRLITASAGQLALAIEREELRRRATESEVLRRADDAKRTLLHAVSHDLRTPLSSIIAGATSLRQRDVEWSDREREEFLEGIEGEARRLDRIVGNLLSVSRIESGSLRPTKEWHDLGALVDDVVERERARGHPVRVTCPAALPALHIDYVEIDQALSNLIENAAGYAPAGTDVEVDVRSRTGAVEVRVSDRGPGVPADARDRVFEPFERADGGRRTGTGLGLTVAKRFVQAHGGDIRVEERDGGGATFVLTLPASE